METPMDSRMRRAASSLAQLTTDGDIGGTLNIQYFPGGGEATSESFDLDALCAAGEEEECTYAEPYEDCDGVCLNDVDADGICDEVDECVGTVDACGVCNGPGAINDCGCSEIPEGDCDCDGNQLDVIGVCGGSCAADADADGICDDVENVSAPWMPSACAMAIARPMWMQTEFAMTLTLVSVRWTNAGCNGPWCHGGMWL